MRKFGLFLILSVLSIGIHAQELTEQEVQAKEDSVFNIKFKEQAHYAELVIDMATKEDKDVTVAEQQSMLLLQTHIIEIFSKRFKMSNEDVREIWDVIEDKCQNVEIKRGTLWSTFIYIAKDAFKGFLGGKVKDLTPEDSLILFGPEEEEVFIPEKKDTAADDTIIPTPDPVIKDTITEPVVPSPKPDIVVPAFCKKLIEKTNKKELEAFLEDGALYNELMYGTLDDMQYISKCYVVIIEKATEKIIGVLDKGDSGRVNFMTQETDYYGKYDKEKYELIFVQEL